MKRHRSGFCFGKHRLELYKKHIFGFWEGKHKSYFYEKHRSGFWERKEWNFYDGFSCRSKILRRNSTLDLCMLINQHIKI